MAEFQTFSLLYPMSLLPVARIVIEVPTSGRGAFLTNIKGRYPIPEMPNPLHL